MGKHVSIDFKGPVAGDFSTLMIDNQSRYLVVQVVKSTQFLELRPKFEKNKGLTLSVIMF